MSHSQGVSPLSGNLLNTAGWFDRGLTQSVKDEQQKKEMARQRQSHLSAPISHKKHKEA